MYDVICNETDYVAVGLNGAILNSSDGINWNSIVASGDASSTEEFRSILYVNSNYYLGGETGKIYKSTDLQNWTEKKGSTTDARPIIKIIYGNDIFMAISSITFSGTNIILTSSDGESWVDISSSSIFSNKVYTSLLFKKGLFWVSVASKSITNAVIYSSPDGINWTESFRNCSLGLNACQQKIGS